MAGSMCERTCVVEEPRRSICWSPMVTMAYLLRLMSRFPPRRGLAVWSTSCRVLMSAIPRRERADVQAELTGIWKQAKKEDALTNLQASTRHICSPLL
jgi:hypothetical protein